MFLRAISPADQDYEPSVLAGRKAEADSGSPALRVPSASDTASSPQPPWASTD